MTTNLCLLAVHAHPDDEAIPTGGTLPLYAERGVRTVLVTCTRGEEGEIVDDELKAAIADNAPSPEAAQEALAVQREQELADAVKALNISQAYQLGYRDSGMAGTDSNANPRAFTNVVITEAVARLIEIVRRERPQVMLTYDAFGGYGHPDHIMAHRIAVLAYMGAANTDVYPQQSDETPPWQPQKLYFSAMSRDHIRRMAAEATKAGIELGWLSRIGEQDTAILRGEPVDPDHPERPPFGEPEDAITTFIDVHTALDQKRAALLAHRSQIKIDRFMLPMPEDLAARAYGTECYILARSRVPTTRPEYDLFTGIDS
jgi:N-acetyl-1-D-myo-inositol-2-amino-2-deoxy-alpha-D-glucopyranoside deacetylase